VTGSGISQTRFSGNFNSDSRQRNYPDSVQDGKLVSRANFHYDSSAFNLIQRDFKMDCIQSNSVASVWTLSRREFDIEMKLLFTKCSAGLKTIYN
jgi:hypothetical protein